MRQLAMGSWQLAVGNRKLQSEFRIQNSEFDIQHSEIIPCAPTHTPLLNRNKAPQRGTRFPILLL
jgi:hypothetical protein